MGKYDLSSVYDENATYTLYDLAEEISNEFSDKRYSNQKTVITDNILNIDEIETGNKEIHEQNSLLRIIGHERHGSGMLDKLNKLFGFDLEKATASSKKERFEMLRLLKLMFYIEKWDGADSDYGEPLKITDLLAKPQPSNIVYSGPTPTKYSNIIYELFEGLKHWVSDADSRCRELDRCSMFWQWLGINNNKHVFSTGDGDYLRKEYEELLRLQEIVDTLYDVLNGIPQSAKCRGEDIWGTFFNIVYCHILLCFEHARMTLGENISPDVAPSREYIEKFKKTVDMPIVSLGILTELDKRIQGKSKSTEYDWLIRLITFDQDIHPDDRKNYHYAIRYAPTVIKMWQSLGQAEYTENVGIVLLCAVIQEIYWCKKNKPQIPFDNMD